MRDDRPGRPLRALLPTLAGVAAGVATSLLISARQKPPEPGPGRPETHERLAAPAAHAGAPGGDPASIRALEQRLQRLEQPPPAPEAPAAESEPPPPEVARAERLQRHAQSIAEHRREPVDAGWARTTGASLHGELGQVGQEEGRFSVLQVDCRTNTCTSELEWPTYQDAREGFATVLHHSYTANCARRVLLPEPPDPAQPYRATVYFDCSGWRAQAVQ